MLPSSSGKPLRAAWYSRVSTDAQAERVTIQDQRDQCRRFFDLYQDQFVHVGTYEDDGVSAGTTFAERPEGRRLIADAQAGKIDVLVFLAIDRIVRSVLDLLLLHQALQQHGVELKSISQPFDTTTAFGRACMQMLGMIAELEREQIKERTMRGRLRAIRNNQIPGGAPAFGYRWEVKAWVIDDGEAKIVRLIFRRIAAGESAMALSVWLNTHSIPTPREMRGKGVSSWHPQSVCKIIHNTTYRGVFYFNTRKWTGNKSTPRPESEWITAEVTPLVSEEMWHAANAVIAANRARYPIRERKYDYLLTGLVRCSLCGLTYVGSGGAKRSTGLKVYYRHPQASPKSAACPMPGPRLIPAQPLEEAIWESVLGFLRHPDMFIERLRQRLQDALPSDENDTPDIQLRLEQKTAARSMVLRMMARGLVPEDEAEESLLQLDGEIRQLEAERDEMAVQGLAHQHMELRLLETETMLAELRGHIENATAGQKRDIIQTLIREVLVHRGTQGRRFDFHVKYRPDLVEELDGTGL